MSDIVQQLLLQFILILLNAFFAATEIAVISLDEKKVRARADGGDKKAVRMLKMIGEPTRFLSTIQIGITLAGFLGSAFAADNFSERLSGFLVSTCHIPEEHIGTVNAVSVILITLILSYFTLVLGELVPKRVAMKHKEKLAEAVCGVISGLTVVLKPVIWFLTVSTNGLLRLFGIDPHEKEEPVSEEDIVLMLDAGADEGTLDQTDIKYIKNVFRIDGLSAEDVMTPRREVVFLSSDASHDEIVQVIEQEGYSRIPVYSKETDNIIGILHTRNYLLRCNRPDFSMNQVLIPPMFVPETAHLDTIFKEMQKSRTHIAIVVNEYGGVSGILSMEDILEELVGEIWDEQDDVVENMKKLDEHTYRVLCSTSIEEFADFFELGLTGEEDVTTLNGWLTMQMGRIPKKDDVIVYQNLTITVTKASKMMAREVEITVGNRTDGENRQNGGDQNTSET